MEQSMGFSPSNYIGTKSKEKTTVKMYKEADFVAEARRVLDKAQQEAAGIERFAYEQGFVQGEEAGKRLGIQQLEPYLDQFKKLVVDIATARERLLDEMEPKVVKLALAIAERVVKRVVEEDRELAVRVAKSAIERIVDKQRLVIHVSRSDYDLLSELTPEFLAMEGVKECSIESDPNIEPGSCIIETEGGTIDACIYTAMEAINELVESDNGDRSEQIS
jgi:flagellar assembly protein FliH